MTSREQFENEYSKSMGTPISVLMTLRNGDCYQETDGDRLQIGWSMWQASRNALVVELPGWDDFDTTRQVLSSVSDELIRLGVNTRLYSDN